VDSEDNKQLILEHSESFLQKRDAEAVRRQLAPDFRDHEMPPGTPAGPDGALQFRAILHTAFPDLRIKIEDIIAEGDRVAVRATWTGTHRGVFPMILVLVINREVTFTGMVFWRIKEGQIMERWGNIDRFGIQQLTAQS
jgi:predicted ester cyclase